MEATLTLISNVFGYLISRITFYSNESDLDHNPQVKFLYQYIETSIIVRELFLPAEINKK